MIVDIHTHTFPDKLAAAALDKLKAVSRTRPFSDGTVAGLAASMARAGVDRSVVLPVATSPKQVVHVNDASARLNDQAPETGIYSLGCVHPDFPDWKAELSRVAGLGLKGVKIHPVYQGVDLDDPRYLRILDRCGEVGLIVLAHAGLDVGYPGVVRCSPEMSLRAMKQVGPVRLILAHMGGWRGWDAVEELLWDTGACLDTSFSLGPMTPLGERWDSPWPQEMMSAEQFVRIVRKFGSRRVLFGTDSPWSDPADSLALLRALPLTAEEMEDILGGNARRMLGIQ